MKESFCGLLASRLQVDDGLFTWKAEVAVSEVTADCTLRCQSCGACCAQASDLLDRHAEADSEALLEFNAETWVHRLRSPNSTVFGLCVLKNAQVYTDRLQPLSSNGQPDACRTWFPGLQSSLVVCKTCGVWLGWAFGDTRRFEEEEKLVEKPSSPSSSYKASTEVPAACKAEDAPTTPSTFDLADVTAVMANNSLTPASKGLSKPSTMVQTREALLQSWRRSRPGSARPGSAKAGLGSRSRPRSANSAFADRGSTGQCANKNDQSKRAQSNASRLQPAVRMQVASTNSSFSSASWPCRPQTAHPYGNGRPPHTHVQNYSSACRPWSVCGQLHSAPKVATSALPCKLLIASAQCDRSSANPYQGPGREWFCMEGDAIHVLAEVGRRCSQEYEKCCCAPLQTPSDFGELQLRIADGSAKNVIDVLKMELLDGNSREGKTCHGVLVFRAVWTGSSRGAFRFSLKSEYGTLGLGSMMKVNVLPPWQLAFADKCILQLPSEGAVEVATEKISGRVCCKVLFTVRLHDAENRRLQGASPGTQILAPWCYPDASRWLPDIGRAADIVRLEDSCNITEGAIQYTLWLSLPSGTQRLRALVLGVAERGTGQHISKSPQVLTLPMVLQERLSSTDTEALFPAHAATDACVRDLPSTSPVFHENGIRRHCKEEVELPNNIEKAEKAQLHEIKDLSSVGRIDDLGGPGEIPHQAIQAPTQRNSVKDETPTSATSIPTKEVARPEAAVSSMAPSTEKMARPHSAGAVSGKAYSTRELAPPEAAGAVSSVAPSTTEKMARPQSAGAVSGKANSTKEFARPESAGAVSHMAPSRKEKVARPQSAGAVSGRANSTREVVRPESAGAVSDMAPSTKEKVARPQSASAVSGEVTRPESAGAVSGVAPSTTEKVARPQSAGAVSGRASSTEEVARPEFAGAVSSMAPSTKEKVARPQSAGAVSGMAHSRKEKVARPQSAGAVSGMVHSKNVIEVAQVPSASTWCGDPQSHSSPASKVQRPQSAGFIRGQRTAHSAGSVGRSPPAACAQNAVVCYKRPEGFMRKRPQSAGLVRR